jgi:hypothetical protein
VVQVVKKSAVRRPEDVDAEALLKKLKKPEQKANLRRAIAAMNAMAQVGFLVMSTE